MTRPALRESMPWMAASAPHVTFRCGVCNLPRSPGGRKVCVVRGMRTYVCAHCVSQEANKETRT